MHVYGFAVHFWQAMSNPRTTSWSTWTRVSQLPTPLLWPDILPAFSSIFAHSTQRHRHGFVASNAARQRPRKKCNRSKLQWGPVTLWKVKRLLQASQRFPHTVKNKVVPDPPFLLLREQAWQATLKMMLHLREVTCAPDSEQRFRHSVPHSVNCRQLKPKLVLLLAK